MSANKLLLWVVPTFTYGFYRQSQIEYDSKDLIVPKIIASTLNGMIYSITPFSFYKLYNLYERIDIKITNKNPNEYRHSFEEIYGYNENTF